MTDTLTLYFERHADSFVLRAGQPDAPPAPFHPPFTSAQQQLILLALRPAADLADWPEPARQVLTELGLLRGDGRLRRDALERVGAALWAALSADRAVAGVVNPALTQARMARAPLAIEMRFGPGTDALAALPWELLHDADAFLIKRGDLTLSRYPEAARPPGDPLTDLPLRVLLVVSRPVDLLGLDPLAEARALVQGLRRLDERGGVVVDLLRPPTRKHLHQALSGGDYHVLHFDGHGAYGRLCAECDALNPPSAQRCARCDERLTAPPTGALAFEDETGGHAPLAAHDLADILRRGGPALKLAVFSACQSSASDPMAATNLTQGVWSGVAQAALTAGLPLAVGMQSSVAAADAAALTGQLYRELAQGKEVPAALNNARAAIDPRGGWWIPALWGRSLRGAHLFDPARAEAQLDADPPRAAARARLGELREQIAALEAETAVHDRLLDVDKLAQLRALRHEFQQARTALARRSGPDQAATWTTPVSRLYGVPPQDHDAFVGRGEALRQLAHDLQTERRAIVHGEGGIGKSALAIEAAHRLAWRYPAGVLWLSLRQAPRFELVLEQIGAFCGQDFRQLELDKRPIAALTALAGLTCPGGQCQGDGDCLLIWDNAESYLDDEKQAAQAAALAEFCRRLPANVSAALTTRTHPAWRGWARVPVRELPAAEMQDLAMLLLRRERPPLRGPVELWERLLARLEGHPLALTLLAPRLATASLQTLWEEIENRGLRGLEAAFAFSFDALPPPMAHVAHCCAAWSLPFDPAMARAVSSRADAGYLLEGLVGRGLLRFDGLRYSFHPLLRDEAYRRLRAADSEWREVHRRAAEYLREKVQAPDAPVYPEEVLEEIDQWERAAAWETFAGRATDLVGSLDFLGFYPQIRQRLEAARDVAQAHGLDKRLHAQVWLDLGRICYYQADMAAAAAAYTQALPMWRQLDDKRGEANVMKATGDVLAFLKRNDEALAHYAEALTLFRAVGARLGEANVMKATGFMYLDEGKGEEGLKAVNSALALYQAVGDRVGISNTLWMLGERIANAGHLAEAEPLLAEAVELGQAFAPGHPVTEWRAGVLAQVRARLGGETPLPPPK